MLVQELEDQVLARMSDEQFAERGIAQNIIHCVMEAARSVANRETEAARARGDDHGAEVASKIYHAMAGLDPHAQAHRLTQ